MNSPSDLPRAVFRSRPEDFVVEEIPAYEPSGHGEHLYITFRKTSLTTENAVRAIARLLDADPRGIGYAGMKDRNAITTQTASFPVPIARDPAQSLAGASLPGIEILSASRHENKLKPGHLIGNRFRIVLRGFTEDQSVQSVRERLLEIGKTGVPNAFGPQRFGRDGDNPDRFLAWLRAGGASRGRGGPRQKREQRLLFSALQSMLFNRVLEQRERDGSWSSILPGDLAKKHDTGGLFLVPLEGPELKDAEERALAGGISATGPMFGVKMRWPEGAPRDLELQILKGVLDDPTQLGGLATPLGSPTEATAVFEPLRHLGEGTRRGLRLMVADLEVEPTEPIEQAEQTGSCSQALAVRFVLPKGGYATTVLARACELVEPGAGARDAAPGANAALADDDDGTESHPEE